MTTSHPLLVLAGPCQHPDGDRPHTWQRGDFAELISHGKPDHGVTVHFGRCRHCAMPLLAVAPLEQDPRRSGPFLEVHRAEQ
jgi:hypothetical protein